MPIQTILVPTDFSPDAERALQWAIHIAEISGAKIHLLHSTYLGLRFSMLPEPFGIPEDFCAKLRAESREQLEALEKRIARAGLAAQSTLSEEAPVSAIVAHATATAADLIVMGTRGREGVPHVLLGSVAERTLRLAPCPVLTVKVDQVWSQRP